MEKSKQGNMMTENEKSRWYVLRTAPKMERRLMQYLNAAGYTVFCPMQIVFKKWNGKVKEVVVPLFPGCLFVEEISELPTFVTLQKVTFLVDNENRNLAIYSDKLELPMKFVQLLRK